ncbi:hypothetical protein FVEG_08611 [Fusarium verticillioides 7600]|uniref:Uncharacterized protein n=1 Tax=Gibberella moniliformis (strain M3125 / FGSC 7600) TaxID=334819 RepID=W7MX97_GIBM7|nr:hypothetical protein FVEG_08611 [Fusarium verticillioides 7600]EWG48977.1 hypothetical protein FVEG_08611 [Fusarium verticillioides 7600]
MRPVVPEEVGDLLKWRPLMLFNKTLLGPAYIESIVSSSPTLITSQGGKTLPLEVWYMIIDFSNLCPENHRYSLVRPKLLQTSAGGDKLVCERYKRWSPFGNIKEIRELEMYRFYLAHPDRLYNPALDSTCPNPFSLSFPSSGSPCAFPTALLASKTKFLHLELTVPDVIKNLEDGYCTCCFGKHVFGSDFVLSGASTRWYSQLAGGLIPMFLAGFFICPVCVGCPKFDRITFQVNRNLDRQVIHNLAHGFMQGA